MKHYLKHLKRCLLECSYPESLIDKSFHRAKLQGPAPLKSDDVIPFITTNYCNLDFKKIVENCNSLLKTCKDDKLSRVYKDTRVVLGLRQPKSLKGILMPTTIKTKLPNGLFKCHRSNCKICSMYMQEVSSFKCSNGVQWYIKSHITCHSKNVLYYLVCNMCTSENPETYTGRTNCLRLRTNNHIDCCRDGHGSDKFDIHVYNCGMTNNNLQEPFFKLFVFMTVSAESKLILYERMLHGKKLDTLNS